MNVLAIENPGFSLRSNPGLELANAFGVFKLNQYDTAMCQTSDCQSLLTMSSVENPFKGSGLRDVLYASILMGVSEILTTIEMLHKHEAFLVSGGLAIIAVLLLEPRKEKFRKALIILSVVVSFYGLLFKLPLMLMVRLNYYVVYFIAYMLVAIVTLGVFVISRKYETN